MAKRVCAERDCPVLIDPSKTRCTQHERARDKARGTSTERGYGSKHQRLRAEWQDRIDEGKRVYCWRPGCGRRITGTHWHLGHDDHDRTIYRGPECVPCNTRTATRRGQHHEAGTGSNRGRTGVRFDPGGGAEPGQNIDRG